MVSRYNLCILHLNRDHNSLLTFANIAICKAICWPFIMCPSLIFKFVYHYTFFIVAIIITLHRPNVHSYVTDPLTKSVYRQIPSRTKPPRTKPPRTKPSL